MTQQEYLQSRPDLLNNWNNIVAYRQNPDDPRWANDPNIKGLSDTYPSLDAYALANNDNKPFDQTIPTPTTTSTDAVTPSTGFTDLVVPQTPTIDTPTLTQATSPTVSGGNYNQVQNATQGGQFATVGQNINQQQGVTGGTTQQNTATTGSQNTTQQQTQAGTSGQAQTQNASTTGTTLQGTQGNEVQSTQDTLGFGRLLQDQAGSVVGSDASRQAWLKDVMQNGGSGFNSQVDQAVRQSLSGPRMTGAGESAQARAAGYAGADIARNNLSQRLAASEQLGGPTGLATLSTAANPYLGKSTASSNTGTTQQSSNTAGSTNTSGFSNLIGNTNTQSLTDQLQKATGSTTGFQNLLSSGTETQAGATTGQSSQAGAGQIPQGQPVKTGGCVLCTAGLELKLPRSNMKRVLRRVIKHKLHVDHSAFRNAARGYYAMFTPVARKLLSRPRLARTLWPLARMVVYEELRVSGRRLPLRLSAWCVHWVGHYACAFVGAVFPVRGYVTDPVILDIAKKNNILFEVQS